LGFSGIVAADRVQEARSSKLAVSHIDLFVAKAVESSLREKALISPRIPDLSELFSIVPITSAVRVASGDFRHITPSLFASLSPRHNPFLQNNLIASPTAEVASLLMSHGVGAWELIRLRQFVRASRSA
jgi:hypothetical protein